MLSLLPRAVPVFQWLHSALVHSFITVRGLLLLDADGLSVLHSPNPAPKWDDWWRPRWWDSAARVTFLWSQVHSILWPYLLPFLGHSEENPVQGVQAAAPGGIAASASLSDGDTGSSGTPDPRPRSKLLAGCRYSPPSPPHQGWFSLFLKSTTCLQSL